MFLPMPWPMRPAPISPTFFFVMMLCSCSRKSWMGVEGDHITCIDRVRQCSMPNSHLDAAPLPGFGFRGGLHPAALLDGALGTFEQSAHRAPCSIRLLHPDRDEDRFMQWQHTHAVAQMSHGPGEQIGEKRFDNPSEGRDEVIAGGV